MAKRRIAVVALAGVLAGFAVATAGSGTRPAPLKLPASIGGFVRIEDVPLNRTGAGLRITKRYAGWDRRTAASLSRAYGGVPAAAQLYSDKGLENMFLLLAVRAPSPRLFTPYQDPGYLGLARPQNEVRTIGDVDCLVFNDPTPRGKTPPADSVHVVECRRSGRQLTVSIVHVTGDLASAPATAAQLVDAGWNALT